MKTGFVKSNNNLFNNNIPINLYELSDYQPNNSSINTNLFIARENGLDNNLFLRAFEINNILASNKKLFPDLHKIKKIIESLKYEKQFLKLTDNEEDIINRLNNILS